MTQKPGRPPGHTPETAAKLDAIMAAVSAAYTPLFYETPTEREIAAMLGCSPPEAHRLINILVQQGRLLKSEKTGRVVPNDPLHIAVNRYHAALKKAHADMPDQLRKYPPNNIDKAMEILDPVSVALINGLRLQQATVSTFKQESDND